MEMKEAVKFLNSVAGLELVSWCFIVSVIFKKYIYVKIFFVGNLLPHWTLTDFSQGLFAFFCLFSNTTENVINLVFALWCPPLDIWEVIITSQNSQCR